THRGRPVGVAAPQPRPGAAPPRPGTVRRGETDAGGLRGGRDLRLLHTARPRRRRRQSGPHLLGPPGRTVPLRRPGTARFRAVVLWMGLPAGCARPRARTVISGPGARCSPGAGP